MNTASSEHENPLEVITKLFEDTQIEFLHVELWQLFKAIHSPSPWSFLKEPGMVLHLTKRINRLIEACHQLLVIDQEDIPCILKRKSVSCSPSYRGKEFLRALEEVNYKYHGQIRFLYPADIEDPYIALLAFFAFQDRDQWRLQLDQWIEYALDNSSITESSESDEQVQAYERLNSLIEACWLIHSRMN